MIRSMTGYGRAEGVLGIRKAILEIKSLNHRYLDVVLRLPPVLNAWEGEIRKRVSEQFSRGRVEVTVRMEGNSDAVMPWKLNLPILQQYYGLTKQMKEQFGLAGDLTIDLFVGLKDVFIPAEVEGNDDATQPRIMEGILQQAMVDLTAMRHLEGDHLRQDLSTRIAGIRAVLQGISERAPKVVEEYQKRLSERVAMLTEGMDIDSTRLAQEVAIMADKTDITEEIVRLDSHLSQFIGLFDVSEAVGRKMDFLIQEMNREVNTLGSKTADSLISMHVVEIKSELSKLREQIQNVE